MALMSLSLRGKIARRVVAVVPRQARLAARYRVECALRTIDPVIVGMCKVIPHGRRAIDVGANNGMFTYALSSRATHVEAFEPQPALANEIALARLPNVSIHNCGLSNVQDVMTLSVPQYPRRFRSAYENNAAASFRPTIEGAQARSLEVQVKRLDDFAFDDVTFIKVDVEGHELEVIEGAVSTIEKWKPSLLVEIEARHIGEEKFFATIARIEHLGYKWYFLDDGNLRPSTDFDLYENQTRFVDERGLVKLGSWSYMNNFVFVPSSA